MNSILNDIKHLLGISQDCYYFDQDIIIYINSAFGVLNQIGSGGEIPFAIKDETATWSDYPSDEPVELIKNYIYLKVRLTFDPPATSFVLASMERSLNELEWRICNGRR